MSRFFVKPEQIAGNRARITGPDALHITKALRMNEGDRLLLCDGSGREYDCVIASTGKEVALDIRSVQMGTSESAAKVTLFAALSKGERMDYTVQKTVELGVFEIIPFVSERVIARPDEGSAGKKTARWQRIADEAAKQSGRLILPAVFPAVPFREAVALACERNDAFFFYEQGGGRLGELSDFTSRRSFAVLCGPEGGFTEEEYRFALSAGMKAVSLGPRILRCETAPVCALALLMHLTGEF